MFLFKNFCWSDLGLARIYPDLQAIDLLSHLQGIYHIFPLSDGYTHIKINIHRSCHLPITSQNCLINSFPVGHLLEIISYHEKHCIIELENRVRGPRFICRKIQW